MKRAFDPKRPELSLAALPVLCADAEALRATVRAEVTPEAASELGQPPEEALRSLPLLRAGRIAWRHAAVAPARERSPWRGVALVTTAVAAAATIAFFLRIDLAPAPENAPVARLAQSRGGVSITRGGQPVMVAIGDELAPGDTVRTAADGRAVLAMPSGVELTIDRHSRLRWRDDGALIPTLDVLQGRSEARATPARQATPVAQFRVEGHTVSLVAGRIGLVRSANAGLAVAALDGPAILRTGGQQVTVAAGHQLRLDPGRDTPLVERLPEVLVLELSQGELVREHAPVVSVAGQVGAGLILLIEGRAIAAGPKGDFIAAIPSRPGKTHLQAEVIAASGRSETIELTIQRVKARWRWSEPG